MCTKPKKKPKRKTWNCAHVVLCVRKNGLLTTQRVKIDGSLTAMYIMSKLKKVK